MELYEKLCMGEVFPSIYLVQPPQISILLIEMGCKASRSFFSPISRSLEDQLSTYVGNAALASPRFTPSIMIRATAIKIGATIMMVL